MNAWLDELEDGLLTADVGVGNSIELLHSSLIRGEGGSDMFSVICNAISHGTTSRVIWPLRTSAHGTGADGRPPRL